jgi:hypothetical protein
MLKPDRTKIRTVAALLLSSDLRLLVCHGTNRERPRLLQRRAGVGRMHYRIRAKESPAAAAAAVALRQRRVGRSQYQSDRREVSRARLDLGEIQRSVVGMAVIADGRVAYAADALAHAATARAGVPMH